MSGLRPETLFLLLLMNYSTLFQKHTYELVIRHRVIGTSVMSRSVMLVFSRQIKSSLRPYDCDRLPCHKNTTCCQCNNDLASFNTVDRD